MNSEKKTEMKLFDGIAEIPQYSEAEYSKAVDRILAHRQSSLKFQSILSSASGAVLSGNYSMGRISHNYFSECRFEGALLDRISGAGSIFSHVDFLTSVLKRSNFQSSTFKGCTFESCQLDGSNFSESFFQNTSWVDCHSQAFNMTGAYLKKCRFIRTRPGNLADTCLDDVDFEDIRMANMNIEFSDFKNIHTDRAVLSFSQMPYTFNGLQYLTRTDDNVRISSHINNSGSISVEEYIDVLKDMEVFYSYHEEFFPLSNILLVFGRYNEALGAILQGLISAAIQGDFRMCKYYCKLLTGEKYFSSQTLQELYEQLCIAIQLQAMPDVVRYQYAKYFPEIRTMLVENPNGYPCGTLVLQSQFDANETKLVMLTLETLDELIHLNGLSLSKPSISISHNSDPAFIINLCGMPLGILAAAALILSVFSNVCKGYNELAKAIVSTQEIRKNHQEIKRGALEKKKLEYEIEKIEMENTELKQKLAAHRRAITESGIIIANANLRIEDFDPSSFM